MANGATRGATREQVLTEIRTSPTPPTVEEIATTLGLHRNSVRLHTTALQQAGLIEQDSRPTGGRGRPLAVFRPTRQGARAGGRNYELLAEVLVDHIVETAHDPEAAAREAGRAWGGRLAADRRDEPDQRALRLLDDLGFEPDHAGSSITLRNCPFRELVDSHQGLVCSLHAGMLEGLLDNDAREVSLTPFTAPDSCTVSFSEA